MVMLAMHPEYQERAFEEICSYYPEKSFEFKYEDFERLPYLTMVVNETLRLLPAAPLLSRQATKDIQIDEKTILPSGTQVLIPTLSIHTNTDVWGPNARKFNPDNFLPSNLENIPAYAYMPFSKGSRNCIGKATVLVFDIYYMYFVNRFFLM